MPSYETRMYSCDTKGCANKELCWIEPHPTQPGQKTLCFWPSDSGKAWRGIRNGNGVSWHCPLCVEKMQAQPQLTPEQQHLAQLRAQLAEAEAKANGQAKPAPVSLPSALPAPVQPLTIPADPHLQASQNAGIPIPQSGNPPVLAGQPQPNASRPFADAPKPPILAQPPQAAGDQFLPVQGLGVSASPAPVPGEPTYDEHGNLIPAKHPITIAANQRPPLEAAPIPPEVQAAFEKLKTQGQK